MGSRKNILFFQNSISSIEGGGVPRVSDIISKELNKRGYNCFFIFYEKDNEEYPNQKKLKLDLTTSYKTNRALVLNFIEKNEIEFFIGQQIYHNQYRNFYKDIKQLYPEKPLFFFLHASPDYWRVTYRFQKEFFNHVYILNTLKNIAKSIIYPLYNPYINKFKSIFNICDKFVLLSESYKQSFIELYSIGDKEDKLMSIPNPLTFNDGQQGGNIKAKENIVVIVSRLEEKQKRILLALKIWQRISDPTNTWKLLIIGTGPDEQFYKSFVRKAKLKNVFFLGKKSNVLEYYQQASIFIMTSIWEGLPMSLLEAQQNGVVPICFDNFSAVYDIIKNGENGFIVKRDNVDKYVMHLQVLIDNKDLRERLASKSIASSENFHTTNIVNRWEELLN